jgi:hypothetical protein
MDRPSLSTQSGLSSEASRMNGDFISVGEALKLESPFKGNKLAFIGNGQGRLSGKQEKSY